MLKRTCKPSTSVLSLFVDYFWYVETENFSVSRELSLPDGSVDIVIDLREDRVSMANSSNQPLWLNSTLMCGPHSEHFMIDHTKETQVIGIHFKPGGAFPFVKFPLNELHNSLLSMDTIWGNRAVDLRDELLEMVSIDEKFRILEKRLMEFAIRPLSHHPAVQFALKEFEDDSTSAKISGVVELIGISHKRFIDIFKKETGYTPKQYSRLCRFQEILLLMNQAKDMDWVHIAISCGYYDQAHFIKDFHSFSGMNPSRYQTVPERHHNHVPVL